LIEIWRGKYHVRVADEDYAYEPADKFVAPPLTTAMSAKLQQGFALHQQGLLVQAQRLYEEILAQQPRHFDALHLLGVIAAQTKNPERALELIDKAIEVNPGSALAHFNRGTTLQDLMRWQEANASYARAIAIKSDYADAYFNRGVVQTTLNQREAALASYERAIALRPGYAAAYVGLANVLRELKQWEAALATCEQAIALEANSAEAYCSRGNILRDLRRLPAALGSYERAIALKPDNAEAFFNRGLLQQQLREPGAALASYDRAIALKPDFAEAYCNRGVILKQLNELAAALASCEKAIGLKPDLAQAHSCRGTVLEALGQPQAALTSYDQAIALRPDLAEAYSNRGNLLRDLDELEAALADCTQAIALAPDFAEAYSNRGNALYGLGDREAALACYDRAIALKPDYAEAHSNRGNVLRDLNQWEAALACYDHAIALKPEYAEAHSNRATVFHALQRMTEAMKSYDRAIAIKPDFATARFNRANALLLVGDFEQGFNEYEWRWKTKSCRLSQSRREPGQALWLGKESLAGKTILLLNEQGFGDTIQFCRYATLVAMLGARVVLEVPGVLLNLVTSLEGIAQTVLQGSQTLPAADYYCPLLSLPLALKTTLPNVPSQTPYLHSSDERRSYWRDKLGPRSRPRVGLVWSGGFRRNQPELWALNDRRNIPLAKFAVLKNLDIEFYSLQKGEPAESELEEAVTQGWEGPPIIDVTNELQDFADTAALIEQLDLVISVDTSTAHLAGAIGQRVWVLNRFDTCWRWLLDRTDSPWYPTATLYRQERAGDWDGVLRRVMRDLEELGE